MVSTPQFPLSKMVVQLRALGITLMSLVPMYSLLGAAPLSAAELNSKADTPTAEGRLLDWVPLEELTDAQKKTVPGVCCGAYIPPSRTDSDVKLPPSSAPIRAYSDEESTVKQNQVTFQGNVAITQGNRSISTERATFDRDKNQAQLTGGVQLRDPQVMVRAEQGEINTESGDAAFDDAQFVLYERRIYGVADHLKRFGDNVIKLKQSEISSCEPGDNSWSIRGSEISLHPDAHFGTAKNMRIEVENVPVFYLPYVRFPVGNERLTGFLTPTPGYNRLNGYGFAIPFYWNIAPHMDATFTPHYMSNRGYMLETELRHLSTYFKSKLDGSFIANDRGGYSSQLEEKINKKEITVEEAYPYRGRDRWYAKFEQAGGLGQAWSTNVEYADLSDKDFLRDMYNTSVDSNRQAFIRQTASINYRSEHWFTGAKVDEYRLLTDYSSPYRELPRIHLDGNYQLGNWLVKLNHEYVNFVENRYFADALNYTEAFPATIYGERVNTDYSLMWNNSFQWGFIRPTIAAKSLSYALREENLKATADAAPRFVVPQASIDAGLYFDRDAELFGEGYLHTLEPRLFYFYSDYRNQDSLYDLIADKDSLVNFDTTNTTFNYNQLFRTTRFAGGDRLDDANQLSVALSSAISSKTTGVERLRVSIGQIVYFEDRLVTTYDGRKGKVLNSKLIDETTRRRSDWAVQASGQIGGGVRVSGDMAYDDRSGQVEGANAGIHYADESNRLVNFIYRYTLSPVIASPLDPVPTITEPMNQLDTSFVLPVSSKWSLIARNNHDFTHKLNGRKGVELDTFAGIEYNDCCYRVRFLGRRSVIVDYTNVNFFQNLTKNDFETGVLLEVELKGLGSLNKQVSELLDKTVPGFNDREKNLR